MSAAESKASGFTSAVRALRELHPQEFDALVAALPPETAALVRTPPLPMAWIPARHFVALIETAARVVWGGDPDPATEIARRALANDLGTLYRIFIRLASPNFVLERAGKIYATFTRNNGALRVIRSGKGWAEMTFEGIAERSPVTWAYNRGALLGTIDATGLKNGKVVITSGGGDNPDAIMMCTWD
jgi:hypothetical protein